MTSKLKFIGILTLSILLVLLFPSVKANIHDNNSNLNLQQIDTTAPVIYFDLSGINSTHNITHVTIFEPDYPGNLTYADISVNNITQTGVFSYINYGSTPPPISPNAFEALPVGNRDTYSVNVDIETDFEEGQHNSIEAEGENTASLLSRSSILFCNNQECWNPGLLPLIYKSTLTDIQKPLNFQSIYHSPLIEFNLTNLSCCGAVYFQVSDPYSDVVSIETSFADNILIVNATNGDSVSVKSAVNFGEFEVKSISYNDPCQPCDPCDLTDLCDNGYDTNLTSTNFSIFIIVPCLFGIIRVIQLRKRKQKK